MKPLVAFYDVHTLDLAPFQTALEADFEVMLTEAGLTPETAGRARQAQVLSIHVTSPVTADLMAGMPALRLVACRSTGYDHVDLAYAKAHDIAVVNVPSYGQDTVAEYAMLLMLAISRHLVASQADGDSPRVVPQSTGHQLSGKTLGVIGTGRIGQHLASLGRGFGMNVIGYDPFPQPDVAERLGFTYIGLPELLAASDYLSLHAPATPQTHHMIGTSEFELMKPGVYIVNTARGSLIDTAALIASLQSGRVSGAGLDVLENEAQGGPDGLVSLTALPNVLITAHNAYNSFEALEIIRQTTISNIYAWHRDKLENIV